MTDSDQDVEKWAALLGADSGPGGIWLRTDEIDEFVGALEHTAWLAEAVGDDVNRWKWLILALHNAVQGVCVCALRGVDTIGVNVLKEDSAKEVLAWHEADRAGTAGEYPSEWLALPLDLFRRVRKIRYLPDPHRLPTHGAMNRDVIKLNKLRNEFIHFVPKGFSLEVSGMPRIVRHCCDIVEHLAVQQPTFQHHLSERRSARIRNALEGLRASMDTWEQQHRPADEQ